MIPVEQVLLIRHGQTDWNVDGRWQGALPVGLNDVGRAQAKALANYLKNRKIGSIYCSDLPRAHDTALAIGNLFNLTPTTDARLQEFNLGIFQGLKRDEIRERYPVEHSSFEADYWNYAPTQGESRRALQTRAYNVFQEITGKAIGPEVAIVSHGGTIRMLLLRLFEGAPELNHFHVENTSLTILVRESDKWRLEGLATVPHL
ncbi:MAG: histidine phosphatase family protein [Chloroflexi bacterium]|nr:histidine phosphatase family protein [Chloroflexota bacterium]MCC6896466.1 histidine phosphatase family protein [Anaerolineae bacterium]